MTTKLKIPKIRFKEFSWEWGEKKLWEMYEFKNWVNAWKEQYWKWIKFINVLDIIQNNYITYDNIIWKVNITDTEIKNNKVSYWDILFQRSSETREEVWQSSVYLDKNNYAVFGWFVIRWTPNINNNPIFINYLLKTSLVRKDITSRSGGSTRYNIWQDSLNKVIIYTPDFQEQQKIASFLSSVDEKIEKIKEKKKNLEEYKKWVMQKIFSQEIRFKDENWEEFGEWEEKNFDELFESISTKNYQIFNSEILENWNFKVVDQWQNKISWYSNNESKLYKDWPVIVFWDHTTILKYIDFDFIIWADWTKILKNKIWNLNYLYYFLDFNKIQPEWYKRHFSILKEFQILFPTLKEQDKIADFLSGIDEKIEKVSDELGKMEEFKKGLLQGMFV
jgi:type I restriction enzyme S subunit